MKEKRYLCIGHCCHDKIDDGLILGGTVYYAANIAKQLGLDVDVLTSLGDDFLFHDYFDSQRIGFYIKPAQTTTVFENKYGPDNQRTQYLKARAEQISNIDLLDSNTDYEVVHLGAIADEIDFGLCDHFPKSLIGLSLQGCLRQWDDKGLVSPKTIDWRNLSKVDIVFISNDDIKGLENHLPNIIANSKQLVMTLGAHGIKVFCEEKEYFFPSYPTNVVDPTGAGDAFATAYLIDFERSKDINRASIYAHCVASVVIEGQGLSKMPKENQIMERLRWYDLYL